MTVTRTTGLESRTTDSRSERGLTLDLVKVTGVATLAAHPWVVRGDKNAGEQEAVTARRDAVAQLSHSHKTCDLPAEPKEWT